MGIIKPLPEEVATRIAAGEVVERPASVVKELVENALDAGATRIEAVIEDGGKRAIVVRDNGAGMDREDASRAFLRYGTSKIRSLDDLTTLMTLGFRGEALAAIAVSAQVELTTARAKAAQGTRITATQGKTAPPKPHAPQPGTTVKVSDLFTALPARQKFLKSGLSEWRACLEILTKEMIAHPKVAFKIHHNGRLVFDLPPGQDFSSRVAAVWEIAPTLLIAVTGEVPHMSLHGVVVSPEASHSGRPRQFLAVNGHPVAEKMVARSVREAFGTLLPPTIAPSYALNLTVHPGMVDINIHPRKEAVRFINSGTVFRFINQAVSQALGRGDLAFRQLPHKPVSQAASSPTESLATASPLLHWGPTRLGRRATFDHLPLKDLLAEEAPVEELSPIITIDQCYLITPWEGKLLIIDQHAAHERVLYDQLLKQEKAKEPLRQSLLLPVPLSLDEEERLRFLEEQRVLEGLGFSFEDRPQAGLSLTAVPPMIRPYDPERFISEVLDGLSSPCREPELSDHKQKIIATIACHAAVKAGDGLSKGEERHLIATLMNLPARFTCPHGRPTHVLVSEEELSRLFKRRGFPSSLEAGG